MDDAHQRASGSTSTTRGPSWPTPRVRTAMIAAVSTLLLASVAVLGIVALVKATGQAVVVPTNAFRSKASIFYALLACGGAIVGFRC